MLLLWLSEVCLLSDWYASYGNVEAIPPEADPSPQVVGQIQSGRAQFPVQSKVKAVESPRRSLPSDAGQYSRYTHDDLSARSNSPLTWKMWT